MPVKSSSSSVLVWPKKNEVIRALEDWAEKLRTHRSDLIRVGYFGSLTRRDWGVGSDADVVVVVQSSERQPLERPLDFDLSSVPVGTDLLVFTAAEWNARLERGDRFAEELRNATWL